MIGLLQIQRVKPMLLKSISSNELKTLNPNKYFAYQKFDGFRTINDGKLKEKGLYGRSVEQFYVYFPEIVKALQPYQNCVFDGELINSKGISKASKLQKRLRSNDFHIKVMSGLFEGVEATLPARYMVFDILEKNGVDLRQTPLIERQRILKETLIENELIQIVKPIEKSFFEAFKEVTERNDEGIVLKDKNSKYYETINSDKRTEFWLKAKDRVERVINFDNYEKNPIGITITNKEGIRCAVNGHKHIIVKEEIDSKGYAFVEVEGLEITENNKIRNIVYKRLIK